MTAPDSTTRFSDRVANYVKYRPSYPIALVESLRNSHCLSEKSRVADVGSGTGLLSKLFLELGCAVSGVEPNREMREAGETYLESYDKFESVDGTAEETGLSSGAFDFAVAGQAFHWFDIEKAKQEFLRILKPGGIAALIWNQRDIESSEFQRDYDALLSQLAPDYNKVNHRNVSEDDISRFFSPSQHEVLEFDYQQGFDWQGLLGRCMSSSYSPSPEDPGHAFFVSALKELFERHQSNDQVAFEYVTKMYLGPLGP